MPEENKAKSLNFRMHEYLRSLEPEREPLLKGIRAYAEKNHIPIVCEETESFLRTVVALKNPGNILEIGSAIGYSTIVMGRAAPGAFITAIESYDKRIACLRTNLSRAGLQNQSKIIPQDASVSLRELVAEEKSYDLIFLDAAKGQYLAWLADIIKLMHVDSVLIADNVLQDETVLESRYLIPHRARSTHGRMRKFLYMIKHDGRLSSSVLSVGDGLAFCVRRC